MLPDEVCQSDNESQSNSLFNVSRWLMILGGLIMLITLLALQRTNSWDVQGYIVLSLLHGLVYLFAVWKVKQARSRPGDYTWILIWAFAFRAVAMLSEPALTTDAFRYVWDGKVQMEGVNPYQYVPADPQLESLRDEAIYPHINKKDIAHTIYPPSRSSLLPNRSVVWNRPRGNEDHGTDLRVHHDWGIARLVEGKALTGDIGFSLRLASFADLGILEPGSC